MIMNKCNAVDMRTNLLIVEQYKSAGIDFVAIPVSSAAHKLELIDQADKALDDLLKDAEKTSPTTEER